MTKKVSDSETIAVVGDLHLGPKCENASIRSRLVTSQESYLMSLPEKWKSMGIDTVVFAGDVFTTRTAIAVETMEFALKFFGDALKEFEVYLIAGNHDLPYENSSAMTSLRPLGLLPNVHLFVDTVGKAKLAGHTWYFLPWVIPEKFGEVGAWFSKLAKKPRETVDNTVIVGHLDIFGALMEAGQLSQAGFEASQVSAAAGTVFSGHYHCRSRIEGDLGTITYLGSPYHLSFAHVGTDCGYSLFMSDGTVKFIENTECPRFVDCVDDDLESGEPDNIQGNFVRFFLKDGRQFADCAILKAKLEELGPLHIKTVPYGADDDVGEVRVADDEETRRLLNSDQLGMAEIYLDKYPEKLPKLASGEDPKKKILQFLKEYGEKSGK